MLTPGPLPDWASPNFGPRREGAKPSLIVLHYTAMANCAAARRVLCDPATEVSAHYLISEQGDVIPLVPEEMRAWHAGAGAWGGIADINSHSIGIELSNTGFAPFAAAQMTALQALLPGIMTRWQIAPQGVIAHSDCAPGRKIDPGPRFDWRRLARAGLAVWPDAALPIDPQTCDAAWAQDVDAALRTFGYTADVPPLVRLSAFRLRFRPRITGPADTTDLALARDLSARYPAPLPSIWV